MTMTEEQSELMSKAEHAVLVAAMEVFGEAWTADPAPPSMDAAEVERCRTAYAIPVQLGALAALMQLVWVTAPPGGKAAALLEHISGNAKHLMAVGVLGGHPAGDFWTSAEMRHAVEAAARGA